jgi:molecular chaperone DnaK (HSP70)
MTEKKVIIGIDLGTTNCTMAYTEYPKGDATTPSSPPSLHQSPISQIIAPNEQSHNSSLPSFIYFPLKEELSSHNVSLSWDTTRSFCVGHHAQKRGGEVPSRLISSAKSWLCHEGIDRRKKTLPIGAHDDIMMSPVEATTQLLQHLKESWNHEHPDIAFDDQMILITVPASFDPSARQLVQEAAEHAGYPSDLILLEEPLAAFYSWLHSNEESWRDTLSTDDTILVIDIGGGTTDFTLIKVRDNEGNLELERQAVGSHLLLGGDNIDLQLAYLAYNKFEEEGHDVDEWHLRSLIHSCRNIKETFLSKDAPESLDVTIQGRGSSLIGGALTTSLSCKEVLRLVVEGFFPKVSPQERSEGEQKVGISEVGLPYTRDARISCQLAKFLSQTGEVKNNDMDSFIMPSAILFNGGTMKASALQEAIHSLLVSWSKDLKTTPVKVLEGGDLDNAVSRGAVYYGLARQGSAIRIKSGTSRSYYIGIEDALPAVPGIPTPIKALCVAPFAMEEGTEVEIPDREFSLVVGEKATFRFFSHATPTLSDGTTPSPGHLVSKWKKELTPLHPIETILEKDLNDGKTIQVRLKAKVTELGVLELWCVSDNGREWKLEFNIRHEDKEKILS